MSGYDKDPRRLEKIMAVCPSCILNGKEEKQEMIYLGEMRHNGGSIANYRCEECGSCRTIPPILKLNPDLVYNEE